MAEGALPHTIMKRATRFSNDELMRRFRELRVTKIRLWYKVLDYHVYAPLFLSWFAQREPTIGKELAPHAQPLLETCAGMRSITGSFVRGQRELRQQSLELAKGIATQFDPDHKVLRSWIRELARARDGVVSVELARLLSEHRTKFRRSERFCTYVDEIRELQQSYDRQHQTLVVANLRLAGSAARKMTYRYTSPEDLGSEATIGLMTAVHRFDPQREILFSTYAVHWIRHMVMRTQQCDDLVRIPVHMHEKFRKIEHVRDRLREEDGVEPNLDRLLEVVNEGRADPRRVKPHEVAMLDRRASSLLSLDKVVGEFEDGYTLLDLIPDGSTQLDEVRACTELREIVDATLARMSEAEADAFRFVSGISDDDPSNRSVKLTLAVLGERHRLSRERIRQLSLSAGEKIREEIRRRKVVRSFRYLTDQGSVAPPRGGPDSIFATHRSACTTVSRSVANNSAGSRSASTCSRPSSSASTSQLTSSEDAKAPRVREAPEPTDNASRSCSR